jgi:hypothetical protein
MIQLSFSMSTINTAETLAVMGFEVNRMGSLHVFFTF